MGRSSPIKTILRSAGPPALALCTMGFFAWYAVMGPNGVLALKDVKRDVAARTAELAVLEKRQGELQNHVNLLDPRKGADPDMVEELLRKNLNVARPGEIIVPLKKK
ncbi:septum formation initiator family protein [Sphingomonas sp. LB-2]|uniref:FtsB family cell division protein n=1 Tax=Sphingomonas caeni TaxID=2984949 RepID=UPI00222E57E9|nr:septum formation initiator family protein [Sphingomonas caeni]MCW3849226.1 septum formation initiator family protein [Sphingomonas caeni]